MCEKERETEREKGRRETEGEWGWLEDEEEDEEVKTIKIIRFSPLFILRATPVSAHTGEGEVISDIVCKTGKERGRREWDREGKGNHGERGGGGRGVQRDRERGGWGQ